MLDAGIRLMAAIREWHEPGQMQDYPLEPCTLYSIDYSSENRQALLVLALGGRELHMQLDEADLRRLWRLELA